MKPKRNAGIVFLITLSLLISLIPLPELHAAGDYYLKDDEVEIITFDDSDGWYVYRMNEGRVLARRKGWEATRYYDYNGKIVLNEPLFTGFSDGNVFSEGYATFGEGIIDKQGKFIYRAKSGENILTTQDVFHKGLIPIKASQAKEFWGTGDIGLMNTKAEWVVKPGAYYFAYAGVFDGLIVAQDTKEYRKGYLNTKGELVIPLKYVGCSPFSEGLATAYVSEGTRDKNNNLNTHAVIIDKRDNEVVRLPKNHEVDTFSHGLAVLGVQEQDVYFTTYGYIDMEGKIRIKPEYGFAGDFSEGLAAVGKLKEREMDYERHGSDARWSFIDEEGRTVFTLGEDYYVSNLVGLEERTLRSQSFDYQGLFQNGLCLVTKKYDYDPTKTVNNFKWQNAVIDTKGRELRLDRLSYFKNQNAGRVYFATLFDQGHALVNYEVKGKEDGDFETVMLKLKDPNMFKPYKVYNINDYHYDVRTGYAGSVNSDGISMDDSADKTDNNANNNAGAKAETAKFNKLNLTLDGRPVSGIESYLIAGNSYLKLRDVAALVASTPKKFSVDWSSTKKLITVTTGAVYQFQGSELKGGDGAEKTAHSSKASLEVNGRVLDIKAYDINGNNYYKLRDLGEAIGLAVTWNQATMTIELSSK